MSALPARPWKERVAALLAGLWAGVLVCVAAMAAPDAFATLAGPDAGRFVNRLFLHDAYASRAVALVLLVLERERHREAVESGERPAMNANVMLLLGTIFCTVAGYFAVQPMMEAARAGQASLTFGQLHAISAGFFLLKGLLVLAVAWRLTAR